MEDGTVTWLIGIGGLLSVLFFVLWRHERQNRQRAERELAVEVTLRATQAARYERLVESLKADYRRLEEAALEHATPDELRARLTDLLQPHQG